MTGLSEERGALDRSGTGSVQNTQLSEAEEFLYHLTHDVKAAIRAIKKLSAWIGEDFAERLDGDGLEMLDLLSQRVDYVNELFDSLLEYSRIGRIGSVRVPVNLESELARLVKRMSRPGVTFELSGSFPTVTAERGRLVQVFERLIDNSIQYSEGVAEIGLRAGNGGDFWTFEVEDRGLGVDEDLLEQIFRPLERGASSGDSARFLGMGLAHCRKYIECNGGTITARNNDGPGTTFFLTWPKDDSGKGH